jgi:hypothetical protein
MIPEAQLQTWSRQGSIAGSAVTYRMIKAVLEADDTPYADKNFEVFLQGSYGNDTNIYAESDVDVVIKLDSSFARNLARLPADQQQFYEATFSNATYTLDDFKTDVLGVLTDAFGGDVHEGEKAIKITGSGQRRDADVIVAIQYRDYELFFDRDSQSYIEGIKFRTLGRQDIINYPKQHSENLTAKHQATYEWLKPTVRIFKNMRSKMLDEGLISDDTAPSYFIEGMLYNVPRDCFGQNYATTVPNCLNWLLRADRTRLLCANERYYLIRPNSLVTWRDEKCVRFLNAAVELWNHS